MINVTNNNLFEEQIFPGFPFSKRGWIGVAFERDRYDNTRMPEWFFRSVRKHFNAEGSHVLLIKGDCFAIEGRDEIAMVAFDWESYRNFMLSSEGFSLEYKIVSDDESCACWADQELTVLAGEPDRMLALLDEHGGQEAMLKQIEREFFMDESGGNEDMRAYFRDLLFPEHRQNFSRTL